MIQPRYAVLQALLLTGSSAFLIISVFTAGKNGSATTYFMIFLSYNAKAILTSIISWPL